MPTTTAESTMPTSVIRDHVPQQYQDQLIADLDRAQAAEAAEAAQLEYVAAARAAVSANCQAREALVQAAIDNTRANLEAQPRHHRVKRVLQHLDEKKEALGYVFKELPTPKVVKRVLKRNGL